MSEPYRMEDQDHPDANISSPSLSGSIFEKIDSKIGSFSKDADTGELWKDLRAAFSEGGPEAVRAVVEDRVRTSRLAVEKDLNQTRSVANTVTAKKKASASKKTVASKKAKSK